MRAQVSVFSYLIYDGTLLSSRQLLFEPKPGSDPLRTLRAETCSQVWKGAGGNYRTSLRGRDGWGCEVHPGRSAGAGEEGGSGHRAWLAVPAPGPPAPPPPAPGTVSV